MSGRYRFGEFELDVADRRLTRGGEAVELSGRYLDALVLLVSEAGRLVSKDRFMTEVWKGVPVTDEALTQGIRALRRALGDDAVRPRFIETAPRHGYRFIAAVDRLEGGVAPLPQAPPTGTTVTSPAAGMTDAVRLVLAGMAGGAAAGGIGGLLYGFLGAADPLQPGLGSGSIVLVLTCVTVMVALTGAAGVTVGIAAADLIGGQRGPGRILGGALGGLVVGAVVKLLGLDGFSLLLGQSPGDITGGGAGLVIGAGVGAGAWLASRSDWSLRRSMAAAGVIGAAAGAAIGLMGGRMMGGSLDLLARQFAQSRLDLGGVAALFGEASFGPTSRIITAAMEGMLFSACVVGAFWVIQRRMR